MLAREIGALPIYQLGAAPDSHVRFIACMKKDHKMTWSQFLEKKLIGTEGARLLREKRVQWRPRRRKGAEEAPGPPAESESLEETYKIGKKPYRIRPHNDVVSLFCLKMVDSG